jgi:phosphohistidine swiveling domain-containing protein
VPTGRVDGKNAIVTDGVVAVVTVLGTGIPVADGEAVSGFLIALNEPSDVLALLDDMDDMDDRALVAVVRDAGATFLGPVQGDLAGLVCLSGNLGSHLAIVSRELGTPALVGLHIAEGQELREGTLVELDLDSGELRALDA